VNLEPLSEALRAQADAETERRRVEVDEECRRRVRAAEVKARSLVVEGRREGERAAAREALRRQALALRRGRELRLQAKRALIDELRGRARRQALGLRSHRRYPELLDRLSRVARSQLGADAELEIDVETAGGVVGRTGRRSVDYSLPILVERAIEDLDGALEALWE
jgi:V/A-type H+-transporting ATPase subunit E